MTSSKMKILGWQGVVKPDLQLLHLSIRECELSANAQAMRGAHERRQQGGLRRVWRALVGGVFSRNSNWFKFIAFCNMFLHRVPGDTGFIVV